jgi:hypothetical protein
MRQANKNFPAVFNFLRCRPSLAYQPVCPLPAPGRKLKSTENTGYYAIAALIFAAFLCGCAGGQTGKIQVFDLTDQRVADLSIVRKITGNKDFLFFSRARTSYFLEGYIQGMATDYDENPIEGVVVRVMAENSRVPEETAAGEGGEEGKTANIAAASINSSFDPGVSDSNGLYRIRFSLPLINKRVDVRGRLIYNPGWEQQKANLGRAYEPQMKESLFRMFYDSRNGLLAFGEGKRKTIVQPVSGDAKTRTQALPGSPAPAAVKQPAETPGKKTGPASGEAEKDIFKAFDFGE